MEIIGLSGYARSGKDEAAKILVEEFGFTRVAFADKLRDVLYALDPIISFKGWRMRNDSGNWREVTPGPETYVTIQNVIDVYGWDKYKESEYGPEVRRLLQRLGTEAGRQTMWDSIWVDAAFAGLPNDAKVVVTDARFSNEAEAIKSRGGQLWRVNRAGVGPAVSPDGSIHPSETSLDDAHFDVVLFNDSSLEAYYDNVRRTYGSRRPAPALMVFD